MMCESRRVRAGGLRLLVGGALFAFGVGLIGRVAADGPEPFAGIKGLGDAAGGRYVAYVIRTPHVVLPEAGAQPYVELRGPTQLNVRETDSAWVSSDSSAWEAVRILPPEDAAARQVFDLELEAVRRSPWVGVVGLLHSSDGVVRVPMPRFEGLLGGYFVLPPAREAENIPVADFRLYIQLTKERTISAERWAECARIVHGDVRWRAMRDVALASYQRLGFAKRGVVERREFLRAILSASPPGEDLGRWSRAFLLLSSLDEEPQVSGALVGDGAALIQAMEHLHGTGAEVVLRAIHRDALWAVLPPSVQREIVPTYMRRQRVITVGGLEMCIDLVNRQGREMTPSTGLVGALSLFVRRAASGSEARDVKWACIRLVEVVLGMWPETADALGAERDASSALGQLIEALPAQAGDDRIPHVRALLRR